MNYGARVFAGTRLRAYFGLLADILHFQLDMVVLDADSGNQWDKNRKTILLTAAVPVAILAYNFLSNASPASTSAADSVENAYVVTGGPPRGFGQMGYVRRASLVGGPRGGCAARLGGRAGPDPARRRGRAAMKTRP